jgi:hypothetical protein
MRSDGMKKNSSDALAIAIIQAVRGGGIDAAQVAHKHVWNVHVWKSGDDEIAHCLCGKTRFRVRGKLYYR